MDPRLLFAAGQLAGPAAALLRQKLRRLPDAVINAAKEESSSTVPAPPIDEEANFEEANDNEAFFTYEVHFRLEYSSLLSPPTADQVPSRE